jgi:hypothetical protein
MGRIGRRLFAVLCAAFALAFASAAGAIPVLSPGGAQNSLVLTRAPGAGAFTDDYDFRLLAPAAAVYNAIRFEFDDPLFGSAGIAEFSARLFDLSDGSVLATGVNSGALLVSNDFYIGMLGPGDYRLRLTGTDDFSGYDGLLRVAPPDVPAAREAVPEPPAATLLVLTLALALWSRRRAALPRIA